MNTRVNIACAGAALLVLTFGWLLPRFIDYGKEALTQLDLWEVVVWAHSQRRVGGSTLPGRSARA